ncbi:hypothetical protein BG005_001737 [Podila minutissima]|nr:hypothetical protein BG005_001737 [Podila minutissima]
MLALWTESTSATLVCTSPTRLANGIRAGSSIVLGFSNNAALSSASDITAQLICSANGSIALTLGSGYDSTNFSPNSPIVNITEAQASAAMQACPSNSFHVQYVGSALLGGEVAKCGDTNINLAAAPKIVEVLAVAAPPEVEAVIPSLHLGEPSATPSAATPTTDVPTHSSPAPTTDAPSPPPPPPTTTTTTPPVTSDHVVPTTTTVPPVVPPATTTTRAHTTTSAKPTKSKGNGNGGGNGGSGGNGDKPAPSTPPTTGTGEASDMQHGTSSSTSVGTIAGACAGVVGGVCAILAGLLVWRKRQQKKMKFDQFYDDSLAAASGLGSKPIYGREEPDEEQGSGPGVGAVVPLTQAHHRSPSTKTGPSQVGSPPPLVPVAPTPVYDNGHHYEDDQQDNYYNDQYHTYHPYELPYQQPYQQAYSQNPQEYYDYSYEMQPTDYSQGADVYEGKVPVSAENAVGYYPQAEYGHEYEYEGHTNPTQQHTTR